MSDGFYSALPEAARIIFSSFFDPSDTEPIEEISRAYLERLESPQKTSENPLLGIYANFSATFLPLNGSKNGLNQPLADFYKILRTDTFDTDSINKDLSVLEAVQLSRSERFRRQVSAAKLLSTEQNPRGGVYRVAKCLKVRTSAFVMLLNHPEIQRFSYGGLYTCSSPWSCPCCSAKISERRGHEVTKAVSIHIDGGGACYMITFTFSHRFSDDLKDLERKFAKALEVLRKHRRYVELLGEYGYFGLIKALECTYGSNGWHPHSHELFFFAKEIPSHKFCQFESRFFECWFSACEKVGLGLPDRNHGLKIKRSYSPAEYLTKFGYHQKWGAGSELSKSNFKSGRKGSRTTWDLLDDYEKGDKFAGAKFIEFNRVFFGKFQLRWSQGLKKLFLIEEKTDQQLTQLEEQTAVPELFISSEEWSKVLKQQKETRSRLLDIAERENVNAVVSFIKTLV